MKKTLAVLLAALMIAAALPWGLTSHTLASPEKSDYYLDTDAEDGYIGNYALISYNEPNLTGYVSSGDLTGHIDTEPETEISDDCRSRLSAMLDQQENAETKSGAECTNLTKKEYVVGETFRWFYIDDPQTMYNPYVETTGVMFTCSAVGTYCNVWASTQVDASSIQIPNEAASELAAEFDRLYPTITNAIGTFGAGTGNKINIIVRNIPGATKSYFSYFEYQSLGNNGGQYMFHLDSCPLMTSGDGVWDVENAYTAMVSGFTSMAEFMRGEQNIPDWLNKMISVSGEAIAYGFNQTAQDRILNWKQKTESYTNGRSVYNWDKAAINDDAAFLYTFGAYLAKQTGSYNYIGNLLDYYSKNTDPVGDKAFKAAFEGTALDNYTLPQIVNNFRIATVILDDAVDSIYGFGGERIFSFIPKCTYTGTGTNVYAGGALLVKTTDVGAFTPPDDANQKLSYTGITVSLEELPAIHSVKFVDWDGTMLKEALVFDGYAAVAPKDPYRVGYTFTGWDKDFSCVTEDITVTATYSEGETYLTLTFADDNGTVLFTQQVIRGFRAQVPEEPKHEGFTFVSWYNKDGSLFSFNNPIYDDTTIYARWIRTAEMYAFTFTVYKWVKFSTDSVSEPYTAVSEFDSEYARAMYASTYVDGKMYGFNDRKQFIVTDFSTFKSTLVADTAVNAAMNIQLTFDMTYDYKNNVMYLTFVDDSYTVYLAKVNPTTGKITKIGSTASWYMGISCAKDGTLYAVTPDSALVKVNPANGRYTSIGNTGFSLTNGGTVSLSTLAFDLDSGLLYWIAGDPSTKLYDFVLLDTATGKGISLDKTNENQQLLGLFTEYTYDPSTYYTVDFVDWDGTILKTETVKEGLSATAPSDPTRYGYVFTGWDKAFTNVKSDLRVLAQYRELDKFTVMFVNWDGEVLSVQQVYQGYDAVVPEAPSRDGYEFTGWDKEYTDIQANTVITAQFKAIGGTYISGDPNGDGEINTGDAVLTLQFSVGAVTLSEEQQHAADFNGDGGANTGDAAAILKYVVAK